MKYSQASRFKSGRFTTFVCTVPVAVHGNVYVVTSAHEILIYGLLGQ